MAGPLGTALRGVELFRAEFGRPTPASFWLDDLGSQGRSGVERSPERRCRPVSYPAVRAGTRPDPELQSLDSGSTTPTNSASPSILGVIADLRPGLLRLLGDATDVFPRPPNPRPGWKALGLDHDRVAPVRSEPGLVVPSRRSARGGARASEQVTRISLFWPAVVRVWSLRSYDDHDQASRPRERGGPGRPYRRPLFGDGALMVALLAREENRERGDSMSARVKYGMPRPM